MSQYVEFLSNHPILVIAFYVNALVIIYIEYGRLTAKYKSIGSQQATVLQNHESGVFLDVREEMEFASGHLIDAISLPLKTLAKDISQLSKYKDKPIIVYCASGNRSTQASKVLTNNDFTKVYNLKGGMHAWQKMNLPVTKR